MAISGNCQVVALPDVGLAQALQGPASGHPSMGNTRSHTMAAKNASATTIREKNIA